MSAPRNVNTYGVK